MSTGEPLRVGALLDGRVVPAWVESILTQLAGDPAFDLRLFAGAPPDASREPRRPLAFRAYEKVDARLFATASDPFAPRALAGALPAPLEPTAMPSERLDVLLRFGATAVPAGVARYGVWSLHHGDRAGPAFLGEMVEGDPVSAVTLVVDGEKVIARSFSATDIASLHRGRSGAYWKGVHLVLRRLRELHERGWSYIEALAEDDAGVARDAAAGDAPSTAAVVRFAARTWGGVARRALSRRGWREDWVVGWRPRSGPPGAPESGEPFALLDPPAGHFHADPFLLERDGRAWLFVEDLDWSVGHAGIAVAELTRDGPRDFRPILSPPHHLSYPFVFEHDGETYLIPESAAARVIELYRAVELPDRWELAATLMRDVEAYDTTLLHRDGRWWMFVTLAVPGGPVVDELFVFHADALDGEWAPHPRNPVVSDVRFARPAGRIFERDGRLIRPAQDSSGRYGRAIDWREIDVLTTEEYAEHTVGRFEPEQLPDTLATHTYDCSESFEVIDALRRRRK